MNIRAKTVSSGGIAILAGLSLAGFLALAARLLLPACAVIAPVFPVPFGFCPAPASPPGGALDTLGAEHRDLVAELRRLSRELNAKACAPVTQAVPEASPVPDRAAWNRGDISAMQGCWSLDSDFSVQDKTSGRIVPQQDWQVCFDASGKGHQVMKSKTGTTCEGEVTGAFDRPGELVMDEPGNLMCDDGSYIYRRHTVCTLDERDYATCEGVQPETGGRGQAKLKRQD